ncbi:MAG TPA: alpha/beta hydrolase [Gammaproteobacteria bacterium]|nr:alpha/beta hydrolase [Gammaproteobacteria bacterium]
MIVRRVLAVLLIAYVAICAAVFLGQRRLQYFPDPLPVNAAAAGLSEAESLTLATEDGERLVVWWVAPRDGQPVYLYLPGNGANLGNRGTRFARLVAGGAGLYALSWRGYGGSTGSPTEAGLMADARAAYADLTQRVAADRVVLYGESLGTTVAVMLAAEQPVRALLLDSSFDSALDVARWRFPWLPTTLLLRDTYRADLAAQRVAAPVLQVHCADDPITPLTSAERLHERFPHGQPLYRVDKRCHVVPLADYDAARDTFIRAVFTGG